jgi:hypothetical protein
MNAVCPSPAKSAPTLSRRGALLGVFALPVLILGLWCWSTWGTPQTDGEELQRLPAEASFDMPPIFAWPTPDSHAEQWKNFCY